VIAALVSLAIGFKFNVIQRSSLVARLFYWAGAFLTVATIFWWGWWKI